MAENPASSQGAQQELTNLAALMEMAFPFNEEEPFLPNEMKMKILGYVADEDIIATRQVSTLFRETLQPRFVKTFFSEYICTNDFVHLKRLLEVVINAQYRNQIQTVMLASTCNYNQQMSHDMIKMIFKLLATTNHVFSVGVRYTLPVVHRRYTMRVLEDLLSSCVLSGANSTGLRYKTVIMDMPAASMLTYPGTHLMPGITDWLWDMSRDLRFVPYTAGRPELHLRFLVQSSPTHYELGPTFEHFPAGGFDRGIEISNVDLCLYDYTRYFFFTSYTTIFLRTVDLNIDTCIQLLRAQHLVFNNVMLRGRGYFELTGRFDWRYFLRQFITLGHNVTHIQLSELWDRDGSLFLDRRDDPFEVEGTPQEVRRAVRKLLRDVTPARTGPEPNGTGF